MESIPVIYNSLQSGCLSAVGHLTNDPISVGHIWRSSQSDVGLTYFPILRLQMYNLSQ